MADDLLRGEARRIAHELQDAADQTAAAWSAVDRWVRAHPTPPEAEAYAELLSQLNTFGEGFASLKTAYREAYAMVIRLRAGS